MWYRDHRWRARLVAEEALMRARFPQFTLRVDSARALFWLGVVEPVRGRRFRVRISYPGRYPYQEPAIRVVRPSLRPGAPHRYADGSLCVHRSGWNSATGTAASMVPLACDWLHHYLRWERTGRAF